eukprot:COSAG01_NODE_49426_length_372_cov_0.937729_1_plen_26_part_10
MERRPDTLLRSWDGPLVRDVKLPKKT